MKAEQGLLINDGSDLPLFSGTPQRVPAQVARAPAPRAVQQVLPMDGARFSEPLPFGARVALLPGGRHELLDGYVYSDACVFGGGFRYRCVFVHEEQVIRANVYSDEIESVVDVAPARTRALLCDNKCRGAFVE